MNASYVVEVGINAHAREISKKEISKALRVAATVRAIHVEQKHINPIERAIDLRSTVFNFRYSARDCYNEPR